jgi:hypothetical protein
MVVIEPLSLDIKEKSLPYLLLLEHATRMSVESLSTIRPSSITELTVLIFEKHYSFSAYEFSENEIFFLRAPLPACDLSLLDQEANLSFLTHLSMGKRYPIHPFLLQEAYRFVASTDSLDLDLSIIDFFEILKFLPHDFANIRIIIIISTCENDPNPRFRIMQYRTDESLHDTEDILLHYNAVFSQFSTLKENTESGRIQDMLTDAVSRGLSVVTNDNTSVCKRSCADVVSHIFTQFNCHVENFLCPSFLDYVAKLLNWRKLKDHQIESLKNILVDFFRTA